MTKFIQLTACVEGEDGVTPHVSDNVADFWSVYSGAPGEYQWVADFQIKATAAIFATSLADASDYVFDDKTYKD